MQKGIVCDEVSCEQEETANAAAQWNLKHPEKLFEKWRF